MHEMSICEGIVQILEAQSHAQNYCRVRTVWLEVGALAAVEVEALRFGFDVVTRDTLAQGARLEIIDVPGSAWCMQCADTVPITQRFGSCPRCGSHQIQVTDGEQLRIKELEVE